MVDVDGLDVGFERVGAGPPLVLLHGYVGDGPTTWRAQLDGLADDFMVVAWDAPGAGRSSDPPEDFGMAGYADCLAGFIAAARSRTAARGRAVVRWRAGPRALPPASHNRGDPDPGVGLRRMGRLAAGRRRQQRLRQALALADLAPDELVAALLPTMFSDGTADETIDAFGASMRSFHPVGFRAMARASAEDLRGALPGVAVPTLLIYGDHDIRAPLTVADHLHQAIIGSTLVVLPGAGHVCNIEAAPAFNDAVRAFLLEP